MKFNWIAENYNKNSQFQYSHAIEALSNFDFTGEEHVLDVGCGDGKITAEIAEKVPKGFVIGIDSSQSMIAFAKDEFEKITPNLKFEINKAENIKYKAQFDLITSFACLHWVKDQKSFLISAKNALKPQGEMILTLYPKHPLIWDAIDETIRKNKWVQFFRTYENPHISYDADIYKSLCNDVGLKINFLEETTPVAEFYNRNEMEDFLMSWLPHTECVPKANRKNLITDIINTFLETTHNEKEKIYSIPFRKLNIVLALYQ